AQFQNIFENVCRCFGHNPTNNPNGGEGSTPQQPIEQVSSTTSAGARRRTNRLELKDKQWDELFEKNQKGKQSSRKGQPPRPEGYSSNGGNAADHETAKALAQAKLAANPPRYRTKRKRSAQAREEIFRSKEDRSGAARDKSRGSASGNTRNSSNSKNNSSYTPQTDFTRLLNPSLALCFATPVRGTEEELDETDMKSVDNSDTATLNTNGEDTITSTLYFDSKYAHIQETRPPMPLFNQFKIGQAKDEIRTIMATDSHSSLRMIKLMQQQQMTRDEVMERPEADDSSSSEEEAPARSSQHGRRRNGGKSKGGRNSKKDPSGNVGMDHDEEMQDVVPDVKAVSSSTDSSRRSNAARQSTV
ncbi:MAG: hypothetical protein SGILL_008345, partial [Bacillariaceae sp.]